MLLQNKGSCINIELFQDWNIDNRYGFSRIYRNNAMLCLSQEKPVTWETVVEPTLELNSVGEKQEYSYPVDAGTSCFMDAAAAKAIEDSYDHETNFGDLLIDELEKEENFRKWANLILDETTGANVVAFSSGLGDGFYDCYFGYNAEGNIVRVVTDFLFSVGTLA